MKNLLCEQKDHQNHHSLSCVEDDDRAKNPNNHNKPVTVSKAMGKLSICSVPIHCIDN